MKTPNFSLPYKVQSLHRCVICISFLEELGRLSGINIHISHRSKENRLCPLVDQIKPVPLNTQHYKCCNFMHYYVQIEFKNIFHFMYKERYISGEKNNIFSTFIIKLFSNPICEQTLYFGQMAIIINHLEQPEHGRV